MPKAGALKSVLSLNSLDLQVNGGRWKLQGGAAIKVRGFRLDNFGDRKIIHGDALPVYVLQEADLRVNGGQFLLMGGQSMQVTDLIGTARGVSQQSAIPVFPVDDDGNFDPLWGSYAAKVLTTGPIAYWILGEAAGAIAVDQINSPAQDGAYTGVTLGQPGIGDGNTSPFFDGTNDFVNVFSAALNVAFDGSEGSLMAWGLVDNVGVWIDAISRHAITAFVDGANRAYQAKFNVANQIAWQYVAGGVSEFFATGGHADIDWMNLITTWSVSAGVNGEFKAFKNGIQEGATAVNLGVWVGNLDPNNTAIGANNIAPTNPWHGNLAHCAIWDRPLTQAEITELATM